MTAMKSTQELYSRFTSRTDRLNSVFNTSSFRSELDRQSKLFCVIRLQHLWGEFCRELLLRSSIGKCYTFDGTYLNQIKDIGNSNDFNTAIRNQFPRWRGHIAWHVPRITSRIARRISPDNESRIVTALSSVSSVDDILNVRNYIVHPSKETRIEYSIVSQKFGIFDSDPTVLLSDRISPSNVSRFEDWVIQLQIVALNAVR